MPTLKGVFIYFILLSHMNFIVLFQHITYNEWLPIVLGVDFMEELDIVPLSYGFSNRYDKTVNPTVINSFASAASIFTFVVFCGLCH